MMSLKMDIVWPFGFGLGMGDSAGNGFDYETHRDSRNTARFFIASFPRCSFAFGSFLSVNTFLRRKRVR